MNIVHRGLCFGAASILDYMQIMHRQHTPLFSMVHSNQFIDFTVNFVLPEMRKLKVEMVGLGVFGKIIGKILQNNMKDGLSFNGVLTGCPQALGINNCPCPQLHL